MNRQQHGRAIRTIRKATGELNRRVSFTDAREWLGSYEYDTKAGYPASLAAQRAYDVMFAVRRGMPS